MTSPTHASPPSHCFEQRYPGLAAICAREFGLEPRELLAGGKLDTYVASQARAIAMYIAWGFSMASNVEVAALMGVNESVGRNRIRAVKERVRAEPQFASLVSGLRRRWRETQAPRLSLAP